MVHISPRPEHRPATQLFECSDTFGGAEKAKTDRLVYQLYGLTEEEIKTAESPTTPPTE